MPTIICSTTRVMTMTRTEELVATHVAEKYTDDQWEYIFELKCYGYTFKELAEWLCVSETLIQYHFRRLGFMSSVRPPLSTYNNRLKRLGDTHARP